MQVFFSTLGIAFMRFTAVLPLPVVRGLGWLLGWALYLLVPSRRKVVRTNLALCFPELSAHTRLWLEKESFIYFAQTWLDRGWLWHAPERVLRQRVQISGSLDLLNSAAPTVIFAPHFMGMDAGGMALSLNTTCLSTSIYTDQANKVVDAWIKKGRLRFGNLRLFGRADGVRSIAAAIKAGQPLYLLPDMDFGVKDSLFVPFFGVSTATVPSLSRFARLGGAQVMSVVTRMTPQGYTTEVSAPWVGFPSADLAVDTARMNAELETLIRTMPAQYYWVHKRFKTRPEGAADVYV